MAIRFWLCIFAAFAVIGLAGCGHTWPTKPAVEEAAGQLGPATFETNMIGKTIQVVGIPKSIKAYHWIETDRGSVQVDTAWPPELLSAVQTNKIVIAAKLDFEMGRPGGKLPAGTGVSVQSRDTPGEWIPDQFILRDVKVLQVLYPTNRTE